MLLDDKKVIFSDIFRKNNLKGPLPYMPLIYVEIFSKTKVF